MIFIKNVLSSLDNDYCYDGLNFMFLNSPGKTKTTVETDFKQSQSPFEDPDTPVFDPGSSIARPLSFEEMVYTDLIKNGPIFDIDSDLGA